MKKRKRILLAALTILAILVSLALPAFAESDLTGEIETEKAGGENAGEDTEPVPGDTEEASEPAEITVPAERGYEEIFVASYGDDGGDGSRTRPLASLAEAARRANASEYGVVYVLALTDLTSTECARFFGHDVYLCSDGETVTVTRGSGFASASDAVRGSYHPALVECGDVTGTGLSPARLFVENIVLDDAGRQEGERYEEQQPAGENVDNLQYVQDAIVAAYNSGAAITLGSGAELRNYGGLSAVRATGGSRLTVDDYSVIRDTEDSSEKGLRSVWTDDGSLSSYGTRAMVEERRSAQPAAGAASSALPGDAGSLIEGVLPADSASGLSSLAFAGPKELIRAESEPAEYELPYALSFTLTENGRNAVVASAALISGGSGAITVTLDERLSPKLDGETPAYSLDSPIFEITSVTAGEHSITAAIALRDDWKENTDRLTEPMTFVCAGLLPAEAFAEGETLASAGKVELTLLTESRSLDLSSAEMTAETKMLPPRSASVVYDVNGGAGAPAPVFISAQTGYALDTETVPTHADVNGKPVVFIGWTLERDERIYAEKEDGPATVTEIDVEPGTVTTVYAAYGYDENDDGIADVTQTLLTLTYDANGGEGAPDPEVRAAVAGTGASFDISETEPTRRFYTFQGWSKDADAEEADYKYDAEKTADRDILILTDTTLYAVWKQNPTYTLYYNANGGTNAPDAQSAVSEGGYVELTITSAVPTRAGYRFLGWSATRRGNAAYYPGDPVRISNGNVMLYAVWERESGSYSGSGGSPRTGDASPLDLYSSLMLLSLIGGCLALRALKKKRAE